MKIILRNFLFLLSVCLINISGFSVCTADEDIPVSEFWETLRGGLLYDNWAKVLYRDLPGETHPSYPEAGKKKGGSTWRCKECHGWDYRGVDGAYGAGSHYSGIKGIRDMVGVPADSIAKIIRDDTHRYTNEMLSDKAVQHLALFVSRGQVDMPQYIDYKTKKAHGDASRGARFYQSICAVCHGFDGKQINFKTAENPEYIGTVAQKNPQETLHKTRNGQPGVPMVALGVLDIQDIVDIVAYTQTLPAK